MSEIIFELKDVHYSYLQKYPALRGINMYIKKGEKVALVGANGCGKSTLLHMLDALIFSDSGMFKVFGKELSEELFSDEDYSIEFRKKVGLVFQNPDIQLFCPTVKEDIVFGPLQLGVGKRIIEESLEKLVEVLDIKSLLDRSPHQLSVGEKRKVAIASTLIIDPEVIILDEPTAGLDPLTTRHIIDLLLSENKKGKTIISSTHDLHIVEEMSDRVHVFGKGKNLVFSGAVSDMLKDQALLTENNLAHVHGHMHDGKVHVHLHTHLDHHHGG